MKNVACLSLVLVWAMSAWPMAVQPGEIAGDPHGPQQVLVVVSPQFHIGELTGLLAGFADRGAKVYVTAPGEAQALWESIKSHRPDLLTPQGDREPVEVLNLDDATPRQDFDKVVLAGQGWYRQFFTFDPVSRQVQRKTPTYAEGLFGLVRQQLAEEKTVGAYGSGLYPLVLSGEVPSGTEFAAYSCEDLIQVAQGQSLRPLLPPGPERKDGKGRPVPDAQIHCAHGSWRLVTASVPNAWYGRDEDGLLMERYGAVLELFVEAVEAAYHNTLPPGLVATVEPAGGPYR